jgi:predicted nucleic acid-binding protein
VTTYVDSSVALRIALGSPGAIRNWQSWSSAISSALTEVECVRTLDRLRLVEQIDGAEIAAKREWIYEFLSGLETIELNRSVLSRAAQPLPVPLKTLDAMHLASAMLWRDANGDELTIATHDEALGAAARAMGFPVTGL